MKTEELKFEPILYLEQSFSESAHSLQMHLKIWIWQHCNWFTIFVSPTHTWKILHDAGQGGKGGTLLASKPSGGKSSILTVVQNTNTEDKTGHLRWRKPGTCPAPRQRHSWQSEEVNTSLLACLQHHIVKVVKVPAPPWYKLSSSVGCTLSVFPTHLLFPSEAENLSC